MSWTYSINLVALPAQTTSTPVASGSSVPACPNLTPLSTLPIALTASREVMPRGLLIFKTPLTSVRFVRFDTFRSPRFFRNDLVRVQRGAPATSPAGRRAWSNRRL